MSKDPTDFTISPMLAIRDAAVAIEWYKKIFDAEETMRLKDGTGAITHCELIIGNSRIMVAEEHPEYNRSPQTLHGTTIILHIYVGNVDEVIVHAVKEGARLIFPAKDQFYGDRSGRFEDPFGHMWIVSTNLKKIPPGDVERIFNEMMLRNEG